MAGEDAKGPWWGLYPSFVPLLLSETTCVLMATSCGVFLVNHRQHLSPETQQQLMVLSVLFALLAVVGLLLASRIAWFR